MTFSSSLPPLQTLGTGILTLGTGILRERRVRVFSCCELVPLAPLCEELALAAVFETGSLFEKQSV